MSWRFVTCTALFVASLLAANTMAAKLIVLGGLVLSAAIVIFPLSRIRGVCPRISSYAASFLAYLVGEFANAYVLARLKLATRGRWLWTRTIGSTLVGQALDTVVFVTLAFAGVVPGAALAALVAGQWAVKVAWEAAATPLTYAAVGWLKAREGIDTYDDRTDFNPIRL